MEEDYIYYLNDVIFKKSVILNYDIIIKFYDFDYKYKYLYQTI